MTKGKENRAHNVVSSAPFSDPQLRRCTLVKFSGRIDPKRRSLFIHLRHFGFQTL